MNSKTPPPNPPHNPDPGFTTPQNPPPSGPPTAQQYAAAEPPPSRKGGWSWRATAVGAVAGGVLVAALAIPVTWAVSDTSDEPGPDHDDRREVPTQPGHGPFGGPTGMHRGDQTEASADQAEGVVLVETATTGGHGAGTGLVLDSSGQVLTNYHVVAGSTQIQVTVASTGDSYDATVVGHDREADVAVLQLDDASDLATVTLDDDGDPDVSDEVTAVGNAQGQGFLSASSGQVVALDQSIDTRDEGAAQGEHLADLIQTDAYVVTGYSGGALLDDEGEVVGVTTAAASGGQAESYAVPIDDALSVVEQIEDGDEGDGVQVGPSAYLGVAISTVGDGVQVGQVESDGAAAEAGIEAGATITGIDDTSISTYDELRSALAEHEPGDSVTLEWTDAAGESHSAEVELGESPVS